MNLLKENFNALQAAPPDIMRLKAARIQMHVFNVMFHAANAADPETNSVLRAVVVFLCMWELIGVQALAKKVSFIYKLLKKNFALKDTF